MNDDEAAAIKAALDSKPGRIHRLKVRAAEVGLATIPGGLFLAWLGVDGHLVIRGLVMASPVLAAAVLAFVTHAWRQNTCLPLNPQTDADEGEPAWLGQDEPADAVEPVASRPQSTTPIRTPAALPPSVTVTVLPIPASRALLPVEARKEDTDA